MNNHFTICMDQKEEIREYREGNKTQFHEIIL